MKTTIYKWKDEHPVELLRFEALGRLYAYESHNNKMMVFKVLPYGGNQGSGNMLKELRKRKKWPQAEAGNHLGVSKSMIAKYESRKHIMPLWFLFQIEKDKDMTDYLISHGAPAIKRRILKIKRGGDLLRFHIEALGKQFTYSRDTGKRMYFLAAAKSVSFEGELLKKFRKKYRLTQKQAAKILNRSQTMIALCESGKRTLGQRRTSLINLLNRGMTLDQIKQLWKYREEQIPKNTRKASR